MVRRAVLLLTTIGVGVLPVGGVALAANLISCPGGLCNGTTGDDEIIGTSGIDCLYAKEGNDTLRGLGAFDDLRGGSGNDDLDGGRGNDQYNIYDNNWGVDRISGDSGGAEDWLIFQISSGALTIDLTPTPGQPEVSSGANKINFASDVVIEWVQAGPDSDTVKGNSADNYLSGSNDDDTLVGRKGNDHLVGDIMVFDNNEGNDILKGGPGNDTLDGSRRGDDLYGAGGNDDLLDGEVGGDLDDVFGGSGDDTIDVEDGDNDDIVCTGPDNDTVAKDSGAVVDDANFGC
jgi:Ca2+-binding RTX toxin-like protein